MTYVYDGNIRNPKWYKQTNTQRIKVHRSEVEYPTTFLVDYCPGLNSVLGEMEAGQPFVCVLFGLPGKHCGSTTNKAEAFSSYPAKPLHCNPEESCEPAQATWS